jgi:RimJ/RimL family protein N-acetyltransferase
MIAAPTLETARFCLRAATRADFDAYAAMWADDRVTRYISGEARTRTESWGKFLSMPGMWALMGYGCWVFADRRDNSFIGSGGLFWADRGVPQLEGFPEAGWSISPEWWGKGAASEVMAAVMGWADDVLGAPEVRCIINPGHSASERVAAKLGFVHIGEAELDPDLVNVYMRARRPGR